MISNIQISNFRSLEKVSLDLNKFTLLTGSNNSGKSSLIYSLLSLKNTMSNTNKSIDNCLTLPYINLGGFNQIIFNKNIEKNIALCFTSVGTDKIPIEYQLSIGKKSSYLSIKFNYIVEIDCTLEIAFPYPLNNHQSFSFENSETQISFNWNGFAISNISVSTGGFLDNPNDSTQIEYINKITSKLTTLFANPFIDLASLSSIPLRRGFTKPFYSIVPLNANITNEDEIATLLATDRDLTGRIAYYLEKIVDRNFTVYTTPGTSNFYLQTVDRSTGFTSDLVNEGLGTNQLVTILAKVLSSNTKIICIDEPEIHLHPSIIKKLVKVLIDIANDENKQFIISTHSEHFLSSMMSFLVEGLIRNDEINLFYLSKNRKATEFEHQKINKDGQIAGGLSHFMESELSNLEELFKVTNK